MEWELDNKIGGVALALFGVLMGVTMAWSEITGSDLVFFLLWNLGLPAVFIVGGVYVYLQRPYGGAVLAILPWLAIPITFLFLLGSAYSGGTAKAGMSFEDLLLLGMVLTTLISWLAGGVNVIDYLRRLR